VLALVIKIPYVGWLIHLAAVIFGAGAFMHYMLAQKEKPVDLPEAAPEEIA
jgi:hypothetical protein